MIPQPRASEASSPHGEAASEEVDTPLPEYVDTAADCPKPLSPALMAAAAAKREEIFARYSAQLAKGRLPPPPDRMYRLAFA